jgi:hypothetical protein
MGARQGCPTGARQGPDGVPDRGQTGARQGPDGVPDGGQTGARRGQMGWRMEGLFTFKRKTDMFCIRVMYIIVSIRRVRRRVDVKKIYGY